MSTSGTGLILALTEHFRTYSSQEKDIQFIIPAGSAFVRCEASEVREAEDVVEVVLRRLPE